MDLISIANQAAAIAFEAAGNAREEVVLHVGKTLAYDYDTDSQTATGGRDITLKGVFYEDKQAQAAATGDSTRFIFNGADVPASILPAGVTEDATLTRNGNVWNVFNVERIPTGAVVILSVRR